jgi:hypothetical protein
MKKNDGMTNDEGMTKPEIGIPAGVSSFVIRHSSFREAI